MPENRPIDNISRRTTLAALGGAVLFIPAWNETVEAADSCVLATPTVTEGPYWVDEKLFRSDIRTDPSTGIARAGVPLDPHHQGTESHFVRVRTADRRLCGHLALRRQGHLLRRALLQPRRRHGHSGDHRTKVSAWLPDHRREWPGTVHHDLSWLVQRPHDSYPRESEDLLRHHRSQ